MIINTDHARARPHTRGAANCLHRLHMRRNPPQSCSKTLFEFAPLEAERPILLQIEPLTALFSNQIATFPNPRRVVWQAVQAEQNRDKPTRGRGQSVYSQHCPLPRLLQIDIEPPQSVRVKRTIPARLHCCTERTL